MLVMKAKEIINKFQEPVSGYEVNESLNIDSHEMHPFLIALIEKSKQQHNLGLSFSHEEAMKMLREKHTFLN
jgi:polynucleotide 5'-kinase involved in rRNA processing